MVLEISYDMYKEFSDKLPCKDMFYFLDDLFLNKNNSIYVIKSNLVLDEKLSDIEINKLLEVRYNKLKELGVLIEYDINKFLQGVIVKDKSLCLNEKYYKNKSIIISMD